MRVIMANTSSAKKAYRASLKKRVFNLRRVRTMRGVVKEVNTLIGNKQKAEAEAKVPQVYQAIDKAAKRGVIKPNAAARKKSRIMAKLKAL